MRKSGVICLVFLLVFIFSLSSVVAEDCPCKAADINDDGNVTGGDYTLWAVNYNATGCDEEKGWCDGADINRDGVVDDNDYDVWAECFGKTCDDYETEDLNDEDREREDNLGGAIDSAPLIGDGIYSGHIEEEEKSGYYKIDLVGPSKLTFFFDVSSEIDINYVGFAGVWIIDEDTATVKKGLNNMYTRSGSRLTDSYTTRTGGIRYIRLMSKHELLDYKMDLDITCVENALSDDGLKKCVDEKWVELGGDVTSAGETIDEALLIDGGVYTGHISEDEGFNYYKVNLVGPSKLTFFFDVSSEIDRNYVGFAGVWIIDEDTATIKKGFNNMYTGSSSRLTDSYTTRTGGVRYIKLMSRHSLLDYTMNLEITCAEEGNFSDDGLQRCVEGEWVNLTEDGGIGEVILGEGEVVSEGNCPGCIFDERCYTIGYRKSGEYCNASLEFISQLEGEEICENNFECDSNVCVSGECIDDGLMRKILNWFKGLFGW
jgi:hypothetical protein